MAYWDDIRKLMKDKNFYVVCETKKGYSSLVQNVFFTKEEAVQLWERLTKQLWNERNYQKYVDDKKKMGYHYYEIEEPTIEELLKQEVWYIEASDIAILRRDVIKYIEAYMFSDEELERFVQISTKEKQRREEIKVKKAKETLLNAIQAFNEEVGPDYAVPTDLLIQERKDKK